VEGIPAIAKVGGWHGGTAPTEIFEFWGRGNPPVVALLLY